MNLASRIDHLVVAADSLERGLQWCEATLGVVPDRGGEHPLMGTHNKVMRIATGAYPRCYLEIIAIDASAKRPAHARWFDLDDPVLQDAVHSQPRLIHFVASTGDGAAALKALKQSGIDRGPLVPVERPTPAGMLRWQISVRADGQRLFYGALPTLIEWGPLHPADSMPDSGVTLQALRVSHPRPADVQAAHSAIGLLGVTVEAGPPNLAATLQTPQGVVVIESMGA